MTAHELAAYVADRTKLTLPADPRELATALGVRLVPTDGASFRVHVRPEGTQVVYDPSVGELDTMLGAIARGCATDVIARKGATRSVSVADLARILCAVDESGPDVVIAEPEPDAPAAPEGDAPAAPAANGDDSTPAPEITEIDEPTTPFEPAEPAPVDEPAAYTPEVTEPVEPVDEPEQPTSP